MSSLSGLFLVDTTGINGSGTAGNIMKWQDADSATNSIMSDNGTTIAISGNLSVTGTVLDSSGDAGTAGQVLSSTGTGTNWIDAASGGGTIDGSGTANRITKWLDADTITDSIIYDNGTSIGIGTSSPTSKIESYVVNTGAIGASNNANIALSSNGAVDTRSIMTFGKQINGGYAPAFLGYITTDATGNSKGDIFLGARSVTTDSPPIERMRITSAGNVGIGTSSPASLLSIQRGASGDNMELIGSGASGYSDILFYNTSKAARLGYIDWSNTQARWNVEANIPLILYTNATERMRITSGGEVLIGTTTTGGAGSGLQLINFAGSSGSIAIKKTASGQLSAVANFHNGSYVGGVDYSDTATIFATSSDYRLKEDLQPIANPLDRVSVLNPINFAWKLDGSRVDGFLAHEVQSVVPEAVTGEKDAVDAEGNPVYQGIDQSKLVPLLTAAIQELRAEIETLKSQING